MLAHLQLLDGDYGGFPIDRLQHSLQTATRAHRGGESEEYVVMALLHDIGDTLGSYNHPDIAAAILKPFVDEKLHWIVRASRHLPGLLFLPLTSASTATCARRSAAIRISRTPPASASSTTRRRSIADYDTAPLIFFEPMVRRVFAAPKRSIYVGVAESG